MRRFIGPKPEYCRRTEDLARDVLRDIGALEHTKYECVIAKQFDPKASEQIPQGVMIPMLKLEFDYPEADRNPALLVPIVEWATGSVAHDDIIRRRIRSKVESFLKSIGLEPGRNNPQDMRLNEEFYA